MKIEVTKKFTFEAAHSLPKHDGKCKGVHGHSYILEVTISGEIIKDGPKEGMVMDFGDLKAIVNAEILSKWDHAYLNDIVPFTPTLENLSAEAFTILKKHLPISKIKMWETATSFAEITE